MSTDNTQNRNLPAKEKRVSEKKSSGKRAAGVVQRAAQSEAQAYGLPARQSNHLSQYGIQLNSSTARQAVILSEIIGKPVSKTRSHGLYGKRG